MNDIFLKHFCREIIKKRIKEKYNQDVEDLPNGDYFIESDHTKKTIRIKNGDIVFQSIDTYIKINYDKLDETTLLELARVKCRKTNDRLAIQEEDGWMIKIGSGDPIQFSSLKEALINLILKD